MNSQGADCQHTVMIVDDEPIVTRSLGSFLELETDYCIETFHSPGEALDYLKSRSADVVISDFLMPDMNGLEFLGRVKKIYPESPRILLTGYADKENAIRGINDIGLFQYVEKPWDNDQLLMVIKNAIESRSLRQHLKIKLKELDRVLKNRDELFRRENMLRQELNMACEVQQRLLPSKMPQIPGIEIVARYQPALEIGGDFYDIIPLTNSSWCILVADTTGHGIQAALCTALLKFAFSSFANGNYGPRQILDGMNSMLCRGLPQDIYVAAQTVEIMPDQGKCRLANAGLTHPFLIHGNGKSYETVKANGMMLGLAKDQVYNSGDEITVELDRGGSLILYTDGLSEARNADGEFFESRKLPDIMKSLNSATAGKIVDLLANKVEQHCAGNFDDDITLVGIEFKQLTGDY